MRLNMLTVLSLILCLAIGLGACAQSPTPEPTPIVLENDSSADAASPSNSVVRASGVIAPVKTAQLGFGTGGRVSEVNVEAGSLVTKGNLLVSLEGSSRLEAAIFAAQLEVLVAKQHLKELNQNAPLQAAEAKMSVAQAQDAVRDAERRLTNLQTSARQYHIDQAKANVILLKDKLDKLRKDFRPYEKKSEENLIRAGLLSRVAQAEQDYAAAVRLLNNLQGVTVNEIDLALANAELYLAQENLNQASTDYEMYLDGPDPDQVALTQARIDNGLAQLTAAQAALDEIILTAPFDGTAILVDVLPGEVVLPGQTVITLSDLSALRVETTDLSERDVDLVVVGHKANVFVEALDLEVTGRVTDIAPQADTLGGDVVYTVYIELDQNPIGLRWGMSVEVAIETE
ncbi:MAG: efflux RND transporter periplasmic adaptor subunit [Anaerolineales bacterium]|jgi:multidrug efflux pump subunit AcrA (membrane-fusion protein)